MTRLISNRSKILIPLATALAAGAIAIGSGATLSSQSANTGNAYTAGTLIQSNAVTGALFNLINLKPGDQITKTVTLKNTGTLPARFSLTGTATNGIVVLPSTASLTAPTVTTWAPESRTRTPSLSPFRSLGGYLAVGDGPTMSFDLMLPKS